MKIFYFFPEKDTNMYRWQRIHFFDELARNGIEIVSYNPLTNSSWDEANEKVLELLKQQHFDLFMADICNEHMLYIDTLETIKKQGLPTLSFRPDNLTIPFNDKVLAPHFDLLWLTSKETRPLYDRWNVKTVFAPYAANPYAFSYKQNEILHRMCFIGTPYGSRVHLINSFTREGVKMDLFYSKATTSPSKINRSEELHLSMYTKGKLQAKYDMIRHKEGRLLLFWPLVNKYCVKCGETLDENECLLFHPSIPVEDLSIPYSAYSLSLASTSNGHTDVLKHPLKIINLRNFEIPMSGGIEFCRFNPELAEYFEDGKEIIFYNSKEEMISKAKFFTEIAKDAEINKIKQAARRRAEQDHTWMRRFDKVFKELNLIY